jgi:hypothetical protein
MNQPPTRDLAEALSAIERLNPESLLLKRARTGLGHDDLLALWHKVASSPDPKRRLAAVEYLLLTMHQASQLDPVRYMKEVFLPFAGMQRRLRPQVMRIVDDIARTEEHEAYSNEDAAHVATKVYRPLVADVFDPYMTLLVATYSFIDGTFKDLDTSNLALSERDKAALVQARIRKAGGPEDLLAGYDPVVRNALSHAGSDGVAYEPGAIVFRNVRRGPTPSIEARRWSHDDLHLHVIALIELFRSIDAAIEVFGIDNVEAVEQREVLDQFVLHALDREQRRELSASLTARLEELRTMATVPLEERLDLLAKILFLQCGERAMPCASVAFNQQERTCFVAVPISARPVTDDDIRKEVLPLIRYLILGRSVFGTLFDRFVADARVGNATVLKVALPAGPLDEYIDEQAGLVDLVGDAAIWIDDVPIRLVVDRVALQAAEDVTPGLRLPRRSRPDAPEEA